MKIILISLFIFVPLLFAWRLILKRLTDKADFQKAENKILGMTATGEIGELEFLIRYFKGEFSPGTKTKIKRRILGERLKELAEKYNIIIGQKKDE
jgi:hypothetical protein